MLTRAPILAIVPTTDITRAKAFYGETLGLTDANLIDTWAAGVLSMWRRHASRGLRAPHGRSGAAHPCLMGS